jgi:transposase|tara:strand:- start:587 stop:1852 length:1266 start_codon:yes stop_codon:yes gene_type:complete
MKEIQAKKFKKINNKTLIATVDIGKNTMMGYWRCPDGTEGKPFEFFNNGRGFNKFWKKISDAQKTHELENMVVGFESTGCYGEPMVHYLRKRKVELVQVNPMHTKRVKELQGNSPLKTDKKDPRVIADIIELGHALTLVVPEGAAAELRRLTNARERSIVKRTALFNQLQDDIFLIFPDFLRVMKDIKTKSAQYLLKWAPTPQAIMGYGTNLVSKALKKVSRGKLGKERAQALVQASWQPVGIHEGRESILLEVQHIQNAIEESNRFIHDVEKKMASYLEQIPYSRFILSIKGISNITAAGLIGEVGDFSKFKTVEEIKKLAGLDLFEISSGKHKGRCRITKRGRSLLRKILFFAAINVVRKGGILHKQYESYLERGMVKMKALIAVARKLFSIIFAVVRDHRDFVENYNETSKLPIKKYA